jgi:hypothetical protein
MLMRLCEVLESVAMPGSRWKVRKERDRPRAEDVYPITVS